LKITLYS